MTGVSPAWTKVEALFSTDTYLSLATTGGGVELLTWLLNHPGASGCMLEARVPYHHRALREYLQAPGPHGSNQRTARNMAIRAFSRGCRFSEAEATTMGLGCSAALATNRVRRGEDRAFVALRRLAELRFSVLRFGGGSGRVEQEEALSNYCLDLICETSGLPFDRIELPAFVATETKVLPTDDPIALLLQGHVDVIEIGIDGVPRIEFDRTDRLLFPGSFNPLHEGHVQLAQAAQHQSGRTASMEISVVNVDKPELNRDDLERRLMPIKGKFQVLVTRRPRFQEKAGEFENCYFALGMDTAVRLFDPRYYEAGQHGLREALAFMTDAGCRFLVAGRSSEGRWRSLEELELPAEFGAMFEAIPQESFRSELSSTRLRDR